MAPVIQIDDPFDQRIAAYANLKSARDRDSFIAEGRWCVQRLIASDYRVESILVRRGKEAEFADLVAEETLIYSLPGEVIHDLVGYHFHRGVLACGQRQPLLDVDELAFPSDRPSVALAILGVTEHENLGSIVRSASALGIQNLLIGPATIDPFSRRVIRVSMATLFTQRLFRLHEPERQLAEWQQFRNVRTIVTTLDADATTLQQLEMDRRNCILVVGNEATGVSNQIQQLATDRVTIPMQLGTDSLNVAVAAAIFMHDLSRRILSDP